MTDNVLPAGECCLAVPAAWGLDKPQVQARLLWHVLEQQLWLDRHVAVEHLQNPVAAVPARPKTLQDMTRQHRRIFLLAGRGRRATDSRLSGLGLGLVLVGALPMLHMQAAATAACGAASLLHQGCCAASVH